MTPLEIILAILALLGGGSGVAGFISARASARTAQSAARKSDVEALTLIVTAVQVENKRLREQQAELEAKVEKLEAENARLRKRVDELERENRELRTVRQGLNPAD